MAGRILQVALPVSPPVLPVQVEDSRWKLDVVAPESTD